VCCDAGVCQGRGGLIRAAVAACALALVMALWSGCEGRSAAPRQGDSEAPATGPGQEEVRLAVLSPALAVILRDLGLEEKVVARHGWDMVLDRTVPVAGDQTGLDYEMLMRARPTHVLLEWGSRALPGRLMQLAGEHGWRVENYPLLTLDEIRETARALHERYRAEAGPWEMQPLAAQMEQAFSPREALVEAGGAGRILLLAQVRPPSALGPGSAHYQVLESIGGAPAIISGGPYITLDAEDVLRLAPDGIILILPRRRGEAPARWSAEELRRQLGRLGTLDVPAVQRGRLALIDHPLGHLPSTALMEVAEEMSEILERWAR
jgi:ABC-type hemin transport system substrate-binding protein